ncbi:hypothetical protein DL768_006936 [Monosporascus sp. mg162]|nr:hypothetical protein DL768_006936 [Monosporascus sp. mg162]
MGDNVYSLYGQKMERYFQHCGLSLKVHKTSVGEKAKTVNSFLSICDSMTEFGIMRKLLAIQEPVLVVGGDLVTDVAGFACAAYRRSTNFIRIPTTAIGLIDASVSIKVAVNYGRYKNRLGAYHAPMHTILDFTFLRTLPRAQINREGIYEMLKLESPNLHEIGLDRVIAYGHTAGLSIDHPQFDEEVLDKGTAAILKTRDGLLKLAVPSPLGRCIILSGISAQELSDALHKHKEITQTHPRRGDGLEAYVDSTDTGYADNETETLSIEETAKEPGCPLRASVDKDLTSQSHLAAGARTLALVLLSLVCLPLSLIGALLGSRGRSAPSGFKPVANEGELLHGQPSRPDCDLQRRTVLVTGVGMAKALTLVRGFHLRGHRVIGADFENPGIPFPGRYFKALATFYPLPSRILSTSLRRISGGSWR